MKGSLIKEGGTKKSPFKVMGSKGELLPSWSGSLQRALRQWRGSRDKRLLIKEGELKARDFLSKKGK